MTQRSDTVNQQRRKQQTNFHLAPEQSNQIAIKHQKFTETLSQTPKKLNPKINGGVLFWFRFFLLLCLVVIAGLWFVAVIPRPF